ncbi:hypothetical protein PENVUL_c001G04941 [Penicillium vulpinum]|uniref:Uncharacterized protein n=1 Tax=Penicillium vulpinum TaxID=29845 RepID=A0A1V6SE73_9EURO|nr:hypothetical protein PENVUL_c001G04941 [Penicillium vulpinum]
MKSSLSYPTLSTGATTTITEGAEDSNDTETRGHGRGRGRGA